MQHLPFSSSPAAGAAGAAGAAAEDAPAVAPSAPPWLAEAATAAMATAATAPPTSRVLLSAAGKRQGRRCRLAVACAGAFVHNKRSPAHAVARYSCSHRIPLSARMAASPSSNWSGTVASAAALTSRAVGGGTKLVGSRGSRRSGLGSHGGRGGLSSLGLRRGGGLGHGGRVEGLGGHRRGCRARG